MAGNTGRTFTPEEIQAITTYVSKFTAGTHYNHHGECKLWARATQNRGYGTAAIPLPDKTAQITAHRAAWIAHNQENIPADKTIDHRCHNKTCINVKHMKIVSRADNNRESNSIVMELMARTHCLRGHEFTANNTVPGSKTRSCLACAHARKARFEARTEGKDFTEEALTSLADAFYRHFTQGETYPLFRKHPEAWENITYQPKIQQLAAGHYQDLSRQKQIPVKTT